MTKKNETSTTDKAMQYEPLLCGVNSHENKQKSENWKDCPKCGLEMTYGKLITEEWYCWNCCHKGKN